MLKKSLTDIYAESFKKPEPDPVETTEPMEPVGEPVVEEPGMEVKEIVCYLIVDPTYNTNGIKMIRDVKSQELFVHPDYVNAYVRQNLDKEMTKAYDSAMKVLQEPDITKADAMECIQSIRDFYTKYDMQGLTPEQIHGLKTEADKWEAMS